MLAAAVATTDVDWIADLEVNGWTYQAHSDDTAVFTRSAVQVAPFRRIWVRYEFSSAQSPEYHPYWSSAELDEVDCTQQRSRTLQSIRYSQANLKGNAVDTFAPEKPSWSYALPQTIQAYYVTLACAKPAS